jgi:spermidine/putrescine transport system permease protein
MTRLHPIVKITAILSLVFLYLPLLAVAGYSINASRHGATWGGFTLDWYARLFQNQLIIDAAWNTLIVAVVSTVISTIIGTALALGMDRFPVPRRLRGVLDTIIELPVVTPDIIFAAALVVAFIFFEMVWTTMVLGMWSMILGHVTFQIAFVCLVVRSRLAVIGRPVEEAARDLYAGNWYAFRRVTLPLILPGVVAGAMLAFTLSLDDFVISFFTNGPVNTVPIYIHASVKRGVSPEIHALSTVIVVVTVLLVLGVELLTRRKKPA